MRRSGRPRVVYISYDGVGEPLGQAQIVAYLERLARATRIDLVSFEKCDYDVQRIENRLRSAGIGWTRLRYHGRPPVLSTLFDIVHGSWAVERTCRRDPHAEIVHARSDVPALMSRLSPSGRRAKLLFDIRGFWADERIDANIWRPGLLYRAAKRLERHLLAVSDSVVTLTHASLPHLRAWLTNGAPVAVIPTCVDADRFASCKPRPGGPHAVWSGSISTWYRFDLAARLAEALAIPLTVLTRETVEARRQLSSRMSVTITTAQYERMSGELHARDVGLCLVRPSFSKIASAPTRFAEFLAAGMPVAVLPGVGDLEATVENHGVGVVVRDESEEGIADAAAALKRLSADPTVTERCRRVALDRFDLSEAVARYEHIYALLARSGSTRGQPPSAVVR